MWLIAVLVLVALLVALTPTAMAKKRGKSNIENCQVGVPCNGTPKQDKMFGTSSADTIDAKEARDRVFGGDGDDTYVGSAGPDEMEDFSLTSDDTYRFTTVARHSRDDTRIYENGGNDDVVDLSAFTRNEFTIFVCGNGDLCLYEDNPGLGNNIVGIVVDGHYLVSRYEVEEIEFSDQTVSNP